jgi:nucleotide-binding universal stress UspA family protein
VLAVSEQEAHTWVDETVESAAAILTRAHLATTTLISEGDPKHAIIEDAEAWQADTIFLGASGITRRGYLVLGSVSTAVAARAHCTVEVVRSAP